MRESSKEIKVKYKFINLEGSNYDVGFQLGDKLRNEVDSYPNIVTSPFKPEKTGFKHLTEAQNLVESFCPGIKEEIQGLADGFNVSSERIAFGRYVVPFEGQNYCSQFLLLSSITKDNSIIIGRSYDYHPDDEDKILLRTKVKGKYGHIGFCMQGLGRGEGINSEGLVVSMTGGGAFEAPNTNKMAFNYNIAIRSLLDNCRTVDKAVELLLEMPVYSSTIYLIADKSGKAALVEGIDSKYAVRMIDKDTPEQYIISTNHYNHPEMVSYNKYVNPWIMPNSQIRYKTMNSKIRATLPKMTKDIAFNILSQEMPDGVCALYFTEWFGTLWSMLFNLTKESVDVCFGPPIHNTFHCFTMKEPSEDNDFIALLVDKKSPEF
ncbi:MAG: C45 family autoproteolytic acyltransferase/hydrolase [Candidatus Hodarchaeota archaeon]